MSHQLNTDVANVATSGPGLAFNVYPEAISRLPISPLWAILFFLMLFTLGLDSQFGSVESIITGIAVEWGVQFKNRKTLLIAFICYSLFFLGLPICYGAEIYILNLLDYHGGGIAMIFLALVEAVVIHWGYGANRLAENIETMIGRRPPLYFIICWRFITPLLLFIVLLSQIIQRNGVWLDGYKYPDWAEAFGWTFAVTSIIWIPGYAVYEIHRAEGSSLTQKIRNAWRPDNNRIREIEELQMKNEETTA